jgi:hypothetical protein
MVWQAETGPDWALRWYQDGKRTAWVRKLRQPAFRDPAFGVPTPPPYPRHAVELASKPLKQSGSARNLGSGSGTELAVRAASTGSRIAYKLAKSTLKGIWRI